MFRSSLLALVMLGLAACADESAPPPEGTAGAAVADPAAPPPGAPPAGDAGATGATGAPAPAGSVDASGAVTLSFQPAAKDAEFKVEDTEELTVGSKAKTRERVLVAKVLEQADGTVTKLQVTIERATQGEKGEPPKPVLPASAVFTLSSKSGGPSDVLDGAGKPASEEDARAVRAAVRGFKRLGAFVVSLPRDPMKPGTAVEVPGEGLRGLLGEGDDKVQVTGARATLKQVDGVAPKQRAIFDLTFEAKGKREGIDLDGPVTGTVTVDVATGLVVERALIATGKGEGGAAKLTVQSRLTALGGGKGGEGASPAGAPPAGAPPAGAPPAGAPPASAPPAGSPAAGR